MNGNKKPINTIEALKNLEEAILESMEVMTESGIASGGSQTTLEDDTKDWQDGIWRKATIMIEIGDKVYAREISNNADENIITFSSLPEGMEVEEGTPYQIKLPLTNVTVKDIRKWGGEELTGRDVSLDLKALTDDTDKGVLKSLGDAGSDLNALQRLQVLEQMLAGRVEITDIVISDATGGTFTLGDGVDDTGALAYEITAGDLQNAINGLDAITGATVVKTSNDLYTVTFTYAQGDSGLEIVSNDLTGEGAAIELGTVQKYKAAVSTELTLKAVLTAIESLQTGTETIQNVVEAIDAINQEVYDIRRRYNPGYIIGAEIAPSDLSPIITTLDTNDKFDMWLPGGAPVEIQIAADTYESGIAFADAINTAIEAQGVDNWVSVEFQQPDPGEPEGRLAFISLETGEVNRVMIGDPSEHSAIADMGFDDFSEIEEYFGDLTEADIIYSLYDLQNSLIVLKDDILGELGGGEGKTLADVNTSIDELKTREPIELHAAQALTWNGVLTEQTTADIAVTDKNILVNIKNNADKTLTVTFQHKVGSDYVEYRSAAGESLSFTIDADEHVIFGPIQGFPRYSGGRIKVEAPDEPTDALTTLIQVQEV